MKILHTKEVRAMHGCERYIRVSIIRATHREFTDDLWLVLESNSPALWLHVYAKHMNHPKMRGGMEKLFRAMGANYGAPDADGAFDVSVAHNHRLGTGDGDELFLHDPGHSIMVMRTHQGEHESLEALCEGYFRATAVALVVQKDEIRLLDTLLSQDTAEFSHEDVEDIDKTFPAPKGDPATWWHNEHPLAELTRNWIHSCPIKPIFEPDASKIVVTLVLDDKENSTHRVLGKLTPHGRDAYLLEMHGIPGKAMSNIADCAKFCEFFAKSLEIVEEKCHPDDDTPSSDTLQA
jgi:hypothetical protein